LAERGAVRKLFMVNTSVSLAAGIVTGCSIGVNRLLTSGFLSGLLLENEASGDGFALRETSRG
jgi:hypothetical protein